MLSTEWKLLSGGEFNWNIDSSGIWQVKPTSACVEPPITNRNQNTIVTKRNFTDFVLAFQFRCPNAREVFTVRNNANVRIAKTRGPQNWGNSGVKIFNNSASNGIEVQILDSKFNHIPPCWSPSDINLNTGHNGCSTDNNGYLPFGQICGSIYMKAAASCDPLYEAQGWPSPTGQWNDMRIEFNTRVYDKSMNVLSNPIVKVFINNENVVDKQFDLSLTDNVVQENGRFYESGPIILQEHDNMVEFRGLSAGASGQFA